MFRKSMSIVAVRRFSTAITAFALSLAGLVFSPVQAAVPVNGSYSCATGMKDGPAPRYIITDGVVTDGRSCIGHVVIPTGVVSLGPESFLYNRTITSINIPEGVTSIQVAALFGADEFTSPITIPASVTSIGPEAFFNVNKVTTLTFAPGSNLQSIGSRAFEDMGQLTSIAIPAGVTSIGNGAFKATWNLSSISVDPGNQNYRAIDGVLFDKNITNLIQYPVNKRGDSYSIPASVTSISDGAFMGARLPNGLTIPASVTSIGPSVFRYTGFPVIFRGDTAPTVADGAFSDIGSSAGAYVRKTASGFGTPGTRWNGIELGFFNTVSFNSKGGSTAASQDSIVVRNIAGNITEPAAPTRDCSTLAGWSETDGGSTVEFPYTPGVDSDITLHAKWNLVPCVGTPGETPNSKVVNIPAGVAEAIIPATDALPAIKLNLAGATGQAVVTVAPISNPDPANSPFSAGVSTKVVDINVAGITGNVTVCLDGGAGENLFHFTGGAWVALPERSYVNGQVCGVTSSFSPFTAAIPAKTPAEIAAAAASAAAAAEQARIAEAAAAAAEQARIAEAAELASRTVSAKSKYSAKSLASRVGIKTVSPKATVSISVAKASKKVCTKSGSTLKTLAAGSCVVTFKVQEPKPKKGKKPGATKTTKTFVVK